MIIQCDKCATRFRLDDSRVTGQGVKVRCTKCQNVFLVTPPPAPPHPAEEAHIDEEKSKAPDGDRPQAKKEEKPAEARPKPVAKKAVDSETLRFDFEKPPENTPEEKRVDAPGITVEKSAAPDTSAAPDLGFKTPEKEAPQAFSAPTSGRKSHFEDIDFGIGSDEGSVKSDSPSPEYQAKDTGGWDIGTGEAETKETPPERKPDLPSVPPAPAKGPEVAAAPALSSKEEKQAGKFDDLLSSISEEGAEPGKNAAVPAPPAPAARSNVKYFVIAGAVAMAVTAALYFTGGVGTVAGKFTGKLLSSSSAAQHADPVRIDTVRGYFVDNRNIGRVFVIEAWIKNLSDSPQDIKEVRGVLYNNSGQRIKEQPVSPGRVISLDDIKNLSREDILKQYRDVSGGTVPPKGAVPVTIVFIDVPKGMAEYGVDIVRNH
jgi:predicted Zn finger-like uncharacterized protein